MNGDKTYAYLLIGIGTLLVTAALVQDSVGTQLILTATGFVSLLAGVVKLRVDEKRASSEEGSTAYRLRLFGASAVVLSTALPYLPLPLDRGETRTAYSFVEVVHAMWLGVEVEGSLSILIFVSVVFAGAAASLLHYSGGYVVLFGVAGYGYVVSLLMEMSFLTVFLTEFRVGMYVATAGAALIVLSSLLRHPPNSDASEDRRFVHESPLHRRSELKR